MKSKKKGHPAWAWIKYAKSLNKKYGDLTREDKALALSTLVPKRKRKKK